MVAARANQHLRAGTAGTATGSEQLRQHILALAIQYEVGLARHVLQIKSPAIHLGDLSRRVVTQRAHRSHAEIGQAVQRRHGIERHSLTTEVAIHEQQPPAIRQTIVKETEQWAEGEVAVFVQAGLWRQLRQIEEVDGTRLTIKRKSYLNFSSNDYLGLALQRGRGGGRRYGADHPRQRQPQPAGRGAA